MIDDGVVTDYTSNSLNQYTGMGGTTYQYDLDGNMTRKTDGVNTRTFTYDDANRLLTVSDISPSNSWIHAYNALGMRVKRDDNGAVTDYVLDPFGLANVVAEYDGNSGGHIASYDHGSGLVGKTMAGGTTSLFTYDAIGNTSETTSAASASIENSYSHEPFGVTTLRTETVSSASGYLGESGVMTDESELLYMRNRFYDPEIGRFLSVDPIGLSGGDFNLYRYVRNSPVDHSDPLGLKMKKGGCAQFAEGVANHITLDYEEYIRSRRQIAEGAPDMAEMVGNIWEITMTWWANLWLPLAGDLAHTGSSVKTGFDNIGCSEKEEQNDPCSGPGKIACAPDSSPQFPECDGLDACSIGGTGSAQSAGPNEKTGSGGYGALNYVNGESIVSYRVDFENESAATAPAQIVTITDQLSDDLDWRTFELTGIAFGDEHITVPDQSQHYQTSVQMSSGVTDFDVQIEAGIHQGTGRVYANFYSINPETGLPPPVETGFLPPEDGTGRGQGYFTYIIKPEADLPAGTEIRNVAEIRFDFQETIATNQSDPHDPSQGTDPAKEALVTIAPAQTQLTVNSSAGGSVTRPGVSTFVYDWAHNVDLVATPNAGSTFVNWSGDVEGVADIYDPNTSVIAYADFSITANFAPTYSVHLKKGFNLIHFPGYGNPETDLRDWLPVLGDSTAIEKVIAYDKQAGEFIEIRSDDFTSAGYSIRAGDGLVVYAKMDQTAEFPSGTCPSWDLQAELNFLGSHCLSDGMNVYDLLTAIGDEDVISSIERFDTTTGRFELAGYHQGQPTGIGFPVQNGEGYLIHMRQDVIGFHP